MIIYRYLGNLVAATAYSGMEIDMNDYRYTVVASNDQGASTEGNNGRFLTSLKAAIKSARAEFASGWKISIMRYGIDGDGKSVMYPPEEVKTFRIR